MRCVRSWLGAIVVCAALGGATGVAQAARPSCDDLRSALALGTTAAEVARQFHTTQARVSACLALDEQRALHASQRARFASRRTERGLPMP